MRGLRPPFLFACVYTNNNNQPTNIMSIFNFPEKAKRALGIGSPKRNTPQKQADKPAQPAKQQKTSKEQK